MNSASARRSQLREFGAHLAGLDPGRFENDPGLPGLLAGALYALDRAIQLGYDETRGPDPDLRQLSIEFQDTLRAIAEKPRRIRKRWRAGFYFLSALYRLASVSDRAHEQFPDWHKDSARQRLESDINNIKHAQRAHPILPIHTTFTTAMHIASDLCEGLLERLKGNHKPRRI